MQAIGDFFTWLFNDQTGVICLIIALLMERTTKKRYFNHEKSEGDWDLFDDEGDE